MNLPERSITVLIAALGGEGGGVLADWIIAAAGARDFPVQSTSIPGVAQRTGATTYYVEIYPAKTSELDRRMPVMTLTPAPSCVDVMVASELLEAGRAMQNGFVTPERTTLIASTHRIYTVAEKMQMGDSRVDTARVIEAGRALAKRALLFDMQMLAQRSGSVINSVLFGALASSGALPLTREDCETAIRKVGKGAKASLKGFALGYEHASANVEPFATATAVPLRAAADERVPSTFPPETHALLAEGMARCRDFQGRRYVKLYLKRLELIARLEREHSTDPAGYRLTNEAGRFLALWMCYEDVIRVADLKTRASRFVRVRAEVGAKPDEPLHITEFLKPGVDEIAALLPGPVSRALRGWAEKRGLRNKLSVGLHIKTTNISGFLMLRLLAWLRPLRPLTARWHEERTLIERWLGAIAAAENRDLHLALEIASCGRLIKGYGDTHKRGKANFLRIMDTLVDGAALRDDAERVEGIRKAREAALADSEGHSLEASLAAYGIAPLPPQPKPVHFVRRPA